MILRLFRVLNNKKNNIFYYQNTRKKTIKKTYYIEIVEFVVTGVPSAPTPHISWQKSQERSGMSLTH